MPLDLPAPIPAYYAATNAHDLDAMLAVFAADATVRDEGRDMIGRVAIREWIDLTTRKYSVSVEPLRVGQAAGMTVVAAKVTGRFPGSPAELRYRFKIDGGKIAVLEIN